MKADRRSTALAAVRPGAVALPPLAGVPAGAYPAVQIDELTLDGALRGVSVALPRSALTCLLSPGSGGKTALLRVLAGLVRPTQGRALVLGQDPQRTRAALRGRVGYLPPESVLEPDVALGRQARRGAGLCGLPVAASEGRYRWLLARLGLSDDLTVPAGALPRGTRRLGEAALALLFGRELLLLDDPDTGLDEGQRERLFTLLRRRPVTTIYTARDPAAAERADFVVVLHEGRLLAAGTPLSLKLRHAGGWPVLLRLPLVAAVAASQGSRGDLRGRLLGQLQAAGYRVLTSLDDPQVLGVVLPEDPDQPSAADPRAMAQLQRVLQDTGEPIPPLAPQLPDLAAVLRGLLASLG